MGQSGVVAMPDSRLALVYQALLGHFGPQFWWPADSPLEVMVGAILTQNTNWHNVEKAIANLRDGNLLSILALVALPIDQLAEQIRPSGYYNLKAQRLKNLLAAIGKETAESYDLTAFLDIEPSYLREILLDVKGVGPETADSILLYAAKQPAFVIDSYAHRFLMRHGFVGEETDYAEMQTLFVDSLPMDATVYNEYHALLVSLAKKYCLKKKPKCEQCPLRDFEPVYLVD